MDRSLPRLPRAARIESPPAPRHRPQHGSGTARRVSAEPDLQEPAEMATDPGDLVNRKIMENPIIFGEDSLRKDEEPIMVIYWILQVDFEKWET